MQPFPVFQKVSSLIQHKGGLALLFLPDNDRFPPSAFRFYYTA